MIASPLEATPRLYRRSALVAGARVAARAWRVLLPVVVLQAVAQALLVLPDSVPGQSVAAAVLALVSFLVLAAALAAAASGVLGSVDGSRGWAPVLVRVRSRGPVLALWFLAWLVAVSVGLALWTVPGVLVVLLTPYLFLAAIDRGAKALTVNLAVIRARPGRWLVTSALTGGLVGLSWLLAAVDGLFLPGPASALLTWLWGGLMATWILAAWAVVYRSTPAGAAPPQ